MESLGYSVYQMCHLQEEAALLFAFLVPLPFLFPCLIGLDRTCSTVLMGVVIVSTLVSDHRGDAYISCGLIT